MDEKIIKGLSLELNNKGKINSDEQLKKTKLQEDSTQNILEQIQNKFNVMFLPKGYPLSVSAPYLSYSIWHFSHLVIGTITGG